MPYNRSYVSSFLNLIGIMADGFDDFDDDIQKALGKAELRTFTDEVVKRYFNPATEFIFEKFLGKGSDGLTFLIREKVGYDVIKKRDRNRSRSPNYARIPSPRGARSPSQDLLDGLTDDDLLALIIPPPSPPRPQETARPQGEARARAYGGRERSPRSPSGIVTPPEPSGRRVVLKIDRLAVEQYFFGNDWTLSGGTEAAENNCAKEVTFLERLEDCQHVVNLVAINNNPLITTQPKLKDNHVFYESEWLMEEYLENGSLVQLIEQLNAKCKATPSTAFLPNRILWGLFYCLLKMVVAMAWPDQEGKDMPEECLAEKAFEYTEHNDLHEGNHLAAAREDNDEGELKVADLNLFDIGKVMTILMLPGQWDRLALELVPDRQEKVVIKSPFSQDTFETVAVELLSPSPECNAIEDLLKLLVAACMAVDYQRRPRIVELHDFVRRMASRRDPAYYLAANNNEMVLNQSNQPRFNVENETDKKIRDLVAELIYCPAASVLAE
ncbi:hypothetical protein RRF57_004692 [Xylaria bambusicola]|uniref:Protein kinase domain-containing protein n=1 Tax=Xylaria bambusicola TaxID=326684 RepID=A0AAN7UI67_9PEZI